MIDHCISVLRREQEEKSYRVYVTDTLRAISENTTRYMVPGMGEIVAGAFMPDRWVDSEKEKKIDERKESEDTRTAKEIAGGIFARMRGE